MCIIEMIGRIVRIVRTNPSHLTNMIATLIEPYATMRGSVSKRDKLYTRMLNGRCIIQHKPRRASPAQQAHRHEFGDLYGTSRKQSTHRAPTEHHRITVSYTDASNAQKQCQTIGDLRISDTKQKKYGN